MKHILHLTLLLFIHYAASSQPGTVDNTFGYKGSTYDSNFAAVRLLGDDTSTIAATNNKAGNLQIHLYPNPAAENLFIEGLDNNLPDTLIISDISGNVVKAEKIDNNKHAVNVAAHKAGRYIALVTPNNASASLKFIKQ